MIVDMTPKLDKPLTDTRQIRTSTCVDTVPFYRDVQFTGTSFLLRRWQSYRVSVQGATDFGYQLVTVGSRKVKKNGDLYENGCFENEIREAHREWIKAGKPDDFVAVW